MSELDKLLDVVMHLKSEIIQKEALESDKKELIDALREQKRQKIIAEIKEEYKKELIEAANLEIEQEINRRKIEDIKSLIWHGCFLAFWIGLAVNQVTDVIGYYKGTVTEGNVGISWITASILIIFSAVVYGYDFLERVLFLYDEIKKGKKIR